MEPGVPFKAIDTWGIIRAQRRANAERERKLEAERASKRRAKTLVVRLAIAVALLAAYHYVSPSEPTTGMSAKSARAAVAAQTVKAAKSGLKDRR